MFCACGVTANGIDLAQNVEHPEAPVCLDVYTGGRLIGHVLANRYRGISLRPGLAVVALASFLTAEKADHWLRHRVQVHRSLDWAAPPL